MFVYKINNRKMFALIRMYNVFIFVSCEYTDKSIGYVFNLRKKYWLRNCRLRCCKFQPCNFYGYEFVGYVFVGYEFISYEFVGYEFSAHR